MLDEPVTFLSRGDAPLASRYYSSNVYFTSNILDSSPTSVLEWMPRISDDELFPFSHSRKKKVHRGEVFDKLRGLRLMEKAKEDRCSFTIKWTGRRDTSLLLEDNLT